MIMEMRIMNGRLKNITVGALACASLFLLLLGCEKESETVLRTYTASLGDVSKTSISADRSVSWSEGDWIWYYSKDGGLLRMFTVEEDCARSPMSLNVASDANYLVAVHGAASLSNYSGTALTLNGVVNAVQSGSFTDGHVAIARLSDVTAPTIHFKNLVSFVKFSLDRDDVAKLVFAAADSTPLHGNGVVNVTFNGDVATPVLAAGGSNSIEVNLNGAGTYYIAVLPVALRNGFTISCYDVNGTLLAIANGTKEMNVGSGILFNLGRLDGHLVDKTGIQLDPYDPDNDWDSTGCSGGTINKDGYGSDYDWDSTGGSAGCVNRDGYGSDSNYDSTGSISGGMNRNGYEDDTNWN